MSLETSSFHWKGTCFFLGNLSRGSLITRQGRAVCSVMGYGFSTRADGGVCRSAFPECSGPAWETSPVLLRGCASQVCNRKWGSLWKPEGIISASGLTTHMFVHANLTVAFQVQISCENKKESRNWSTRCIELSCSCNIYPEAVSRSSLPRALCLQRCTQHLVSLCSAIYF